MYITVFTPTYNRGYIIEQLYHSLQRQTYQDFEWIVIDDGSTDDTERKFQIFENDNNHFPITYKKVKNGGKHRAINLGVKMAQGEMFFIVDSDDYLTDDALENIVRIEDTIPKDQKTQFAGVCGECGYSIDQIMGTTFAGDTLDITMLDRKKNGITGDKAEVFYTDILKKYPFPEFEGENFITECVVWDKIAADGYMLRFFNKIIYIAEYLEDGLTKNSFAMFDKNPKGYGLYIYQCGLYGQICGVNKWNRYLNFYYQFRRRLSFTDISKALNMNPVKLRLRILGLQLFYKLYDR